MTTQTAFPPTPSTPRNAEPATAHRPRKTNHAGAATHTRPTRHDTGDPPTTTLVHAAANGDETAWRTLLTRYNSLIWWAVRSYRFEPEQAADIVQQTWTKLVEHIHRIRDPERLGGWLVQTATHLSTATRTRTAREHLLPDDPRDPATDTSPEHSTLRRDQHTTLHQAIARLSHRDRALLTHLILNPISYTQISRILNMPTGSIGPTRARVLHRLRTELANLDMTDAGLH